MIPKKMAYIFEQGWFMTEIVKHLLDSENTTYYSDEDKINVMGSYGMNTSHVQGYNFQNVDIEVFAGDELLYLSMLQNTVDPIGAEEENELCNRLINLKKICSSLCLVSKKIGETFKEALSVDWTNNKYSVLQRIMKLQDSYFGLLRWGPYWSQNLDEEFTEIIFPNILIEMRNFVIDEIMDDRFFPGDLFAYKINTILWLNKDAIYLRNRKRYITNIRPQMLNTIRMDNWDLLEDPYTTLRCRIRDVDFKIVVTDANWDKFHGLRYRCHTEKVSGKEISC
jgi:hypothetical protein